MTKVVSKTLVASWSTLLRACLHKLSCVAKARMKQNVGKKQEQDLGKLRPLQLGDTTGNLQTFHHEVFAHHGTRGLPTFAHPRQYLQKMRIS